jgi:hypothetical protein
MPKPTNRVRILRLLNNNGGVLSHRKIQEKLNLADPAYNKLKTILLHEGLVEKARMHGGGLRLTEKGRHEAAVGPVSNAQDQQSSGSGFFVSAEGHILTNAHVVDDAKRVRVIFARQSISAKIIAIDAANDLALLQVALAPIAVPAFRTDVRVGEDVAVYGFPLSGLLSKSDNFTYGSVSAARFGEDTSKFQISAPSQAGNSGSPVLDHYGNVVGVLVGGLDELAVARDLGPFPQLVNAAIKASAALSFLQSNRINPRVAASGLPPPSPWPDIVEQARGYAVLIECNAIDDIEIEGEFNTPKTAQRKQELLQRADFGTIVAFAKAVALRSGQSQLTPGSILAGAGLAHRQGQLSEAVTLLQQHGTELLKATESLGLVTTGKVEPVTDRTLPLDDCLKAVLKEERYASIEEFLTALTAAVPGALA